MIYESSSISSSEICSISLNSKPPYVTLIFVFCTPFWNTHNCSTLHITSGTRLENFLLCSVVVKHVQRKEMPWQAQLGITLTKLTRQRRDLSDDVKLSHGWRIQIRLPWCELSRQLTIDLRGQARPHRPHRLPHLRNRILLNFPPLGSFANAIHPRSPL